MVVALRVLERTHASVAKNAGRQVKAVQKVSVRRVTVTALRKMPKVTYGSIRTACNYQCEHCAAVYIAPQPLARHLSKAHGIRGKTAVPGRDWTPTLRIAL